MNGYWGGEGSGPVNVGPSVPRKLKIWAPNLDRTERTGFLALRTVVEGADLMSLYIVSARTISQPEKWEEFSPLCVVQDAMTGDVLYSPRSAPALPEPLVLITKRMREWLEEHPGWPRELELESSPVMIDGELPPYDNEPPGEGLTR
jgi:hypothetical protein